MLRMTLHRNHCHSEDFLLKIYTSSLIIAQFFPQIATAGSSDGFVGKGTRSDTSYVFIRFVDTNSGNRYVTKSETNFGYEERRSLMEDDALVRWVHERAPRTLESVRELPHVHQRTQAAVTFQAIAKISPVHLTEPAQRGTVRHEKELLRVVAATARIRPRQQGVLVATGLLSKGLVREPCPHHGRQAFRVRDWIEVFWATAGLLSLRRKRSAL